MDDQVISLMNRVRDPLAEKITVYDSSGSAVTIPEKNIISIAIDAPQDAINTLSGKIVKLSGITSKTAYSNVVSDGSVSEG